AEVVIQRLDAALTARLRALARDQGVPLHDLLLAAYQTLLYRYTGQPDLTTGVLRAGRTPSFARVVGYFVNPLPLRAHLHPDDAFLQHLAGMSRALEEAVAHELPSPVLVEALQPPRDPARNPIFQALFSWQKTSALLDRRAVRAFVLHEADGDMEVAGVPLQSITLKRWVTQFDFSLMVGEGEDDLTLTLEYNADILREGTVQAMLRAYRALLEDIVARPDAPIGSLNLVDDAMRAQLDAWGNVGREDAPLPRDDLIHAWFQRQAAAAPDAIALALGDETLTYAALDARANQLAHALIARGVGPEDRVALLLAPSFDMIAAILGVLKAGAAYVPLDPSYPPERLRYMIEDSAARLVISHLYSVFSVQYSDRGYENADEELNTEHLSDAAPANTASELILDAEVLYLDELNTERWPASAPNVPLHPANAAYVIYTSGTTGRPKGVVVTHANVTRLMAAAQPLFHFGPEEVWTLFHSYAFDFSVWEMWGALFFGGRLEIIPREIARDPEAFYDLLARRGVTVLNQTPSAFRQLMAVEARRDAPVDLALRWVIFGGEALDMTALGAWFQRHGDQRPRLVNMYGITETTVHVTWRPISQADAQRPASLIGPPLPHLSLHLLDPNGLPVPIGAVGEIHVGGAGLARGYLHRPALTAERFVPDPFLTLENHEGTKARRHEEEKSEKIRENPLHPRHPRRIETPVTGQRLYRSGDLARWTPDGDLQYLGRADHQVKIRGFRVESGEIAAVLEQRDDVAAAVVLAWGDPARTEDMRLAAYLAPAGPTPPDPETLRAWLAERLPAYMIPAAFVILPQLPLTPQGKIDHRALPEPDWSQAARAGQSRTPSTPLERELAALWEDLLGVTGVGVEDDFFALGGHSLLVIRLLARIEDRFRVRIPVQT
ncbi:MAG TPA: amino acid adenylation domain-containing protein, partial [Anaerolineae bacterium]|nr:amino acid adenylation domain-containing protein [Anaerolineae bacterium]